MKLTKYAHSCILVEDDGRVGLFDPGNYSYQFGNFKVDNLNQLDDLMITHEHQDHLFMPFIKAVTAKFPNINIVTTEVAKQQLAAEGISNVSTVGNSYIELFKADHESMEPLFSVNQNVGVHYLNKLSHPGDSHHFEATKAVLALPITAPWGTVAKAAEIGQTLKPKYIIPIHDWQYNDDARAGMYDRLSAFFDQLGITFLKPVDGQTIEIDVWNLAYFTTTFALRKSC